MATFHIPLPHVTRLHVKNYRSLADVAIDLSQVNIVFGPNGAGKSTLLDALWFVRDCANRSVENASSYRSHWVGLCLDGADVRDSLSIEIGTRDI